jgi:hypothetical protein
MTWAQRLKRVFSIDIETCQACGNTMKVIIAQDSRRKLGFARFGETIENVLKGIKEFRKGPE